MYEEAEQRERKIIEGRNRSVRVIRTLDRRCGTDRFSSPCLAKASRV